MYFVALRKILKGENWILIWKNSWNLTMGKFCWNPGDFKRAPFVDFPIQWGSFVFYLETEFDGKLADTLITELSGMCAKPALPSCWAPWKTHHLGVCPGKVNHWVSSASQPFKAMPVDWTDRVSSFSLFLWSSLLCSAAFFHLLGTPHRRSLSIGYCWRHWNGDHDLRANIWCCHSAFWLQRLLESETWESYSLRLSLRVFIL